MGTYIVFIDFTYFEVLSPDFYKFKIYLLLTTIKEERGQKHENENQNF